MKPMNGNWIDELENRGVLKKLDGPVPRLDGGLTLICDSETNPTLIVPFETPNCPVRLIAHEAGVLIASPEKDLRRKTGIDPIMAVIEPLIRCWNEGIRRVILCVSPHSIAGPMLKMHTVELIDHMLRVSRWIREQIEDLPVGHVVHVPHESGGYTNYFVESGQWDAFYHIYEMENLGRQDDPDPDYPTSASPLPEGFASVANSEW